MSSSNARRVPLFLSVHSRSSVQLKRNIFIQWNFNMNDFSSDTNSQQRFVVFRITSPFTLALRTNLHDINRTYTLYANWEHWLCTNRTSRSFEQLTTHNKVPVVLSPSSTNRNLWIQNLFHLKNTSWLWRLTQFVWMLWIQPPPLPQPENDWTSILKVLPSGTQQQREKFYGDKMKFSTAFAWKRQWIF